MSIASTSAQAEALPQKRTLPGEIGYNPEEAMQQIDLGDGPSLASLPERHPEDRTREPTARPETNTPSVPPSTADAASTHSKRSIISLFKRKTTPGSKHTLLAGVRLSSLVILLFQLGLYGLTITGWVISSRRLSRKRGDGSAAVAAFGGSNASIFIHIAFVLALVGQTLFLERRIYRMRAERYAFLHPGQILPSHRNRSAMGRELEQGGEMPLALAPWNRPPLPSYAATLAQSGVGTGDVEDHLIAAPPPPAYGNTRGSTLLLSTFLRNSLRAHRPESSQSQGERADRPVSYGRDDAAWQETCDAQRARNLEESLARLEEGGAQPVLPASRP